MTAYPVSTRADNRANDSPTASSPCQGEEWNRPEGGDGNINRRSAATLDPLAGLEERPDIVTLQGVALSRAAEIEARLRSLGYERVIYSGARALLNGELA
jgi:hypothetical protein